MRWFRFYNETRHDPKVQRLPADLFRVWVNLLCYANENGGSIPGTPDDLAYEMRMPLAKAMKCIEQLKQAGLLDQGETLHPHNWNARQYKSDDVSSRVKRFRERKSNVPCNVTETADETPPDTEADTEQKQIVPPVAPQGAKSKRGTRLADDWKPDEQDREHAEGLGLDPDGTAAEFRDYWIAKPSNATKLDWRATWRTWCRRAARDAANSNGRSGRMVHRQGPNSLIAAARAVAAQIEGEQ